MQSTIKYAAKDDCFSLYLRRALKRKGVETTLLAQQEKTPTRLLLEYHQGLKPCPEYLRRFVHTPYCILFQERCKFMQARDADLVVLGSFSDLFIKLYRHQELGWAFFDLRSTLNQDLVKQHFDREDLPDLNQVICDICTLLEIIRPFHPRAKFVWIDYPFIQDPSQRKRVINVDYNKIQQRYDKFLGLVESTLPALGIYVLKVPDFAVAPRDDWQIWHYTDATYDYAAKLVLEDVL